MNEWIWESDVQWGSETIERSRTLTKSKNRSRVLLRIVLFYLTCGASLPCLTFLALPYLALPYLVLPYLALSYPGLHYLDLLYLALPYLASPCLALPYLALLYLALPYLDLSWHVFTACLVFLSRPYNPTLYSYRIPWFVKRSLHLHCWHYLPLSPHFLPYCILNYYYYFTPPYRLD